MRVIKSINNNVSHCLDSSGREVIAFGKGIGFYKADEEIPLSKINRTFYNVKDTYYGILRSISTLCINTAIEIVDMVSDELSVSFPSSTAIAIADHLQFAIDRKQKNIYLEQPLLMDLRMLYPKEMCLAQKSLDIIEKRTGVRLPRPEAGTFALHFINDRMDEKPPQKENTEAVIEQCTRIIEEHFKITIDRESFNYGRFATHQDYLIRRLLANEQIKSQNEEIFAEMKKQYPESFACAGRIADYLNSYYHDRLNDEEILYLAIHINRMISRID